MTLASGDALAEVRRAYWYVEQYQQRVLDAFSMIESQLVAFGFAHWQWKSSSTYRSDAKRPLDLGAHNWLPLLDLEVTWSHGAKEEVDNGIGTYVVVRHFADTQRDASGTARAAPSGDDSVLHALVVRPSKGFTRDEFSKDWIGCTAIHFRLDAQELGSFDARKPNAGRTVDGGRWWAHVFSLRDVERPVDFAIKFVDPLVTMAREFAGLA